MNKGTLPSASALPLVTFIIVCWNNESLLEELFATIEAQTYKNYQVIFVDNASTDGSVAFVKKRYPKAVLIEEPKNQGFAIGNNIGIARALQNPDCQYAMLLNTDARLDPDWLEKMIAFAIKHPKTASLQSPTVDYYDHTVLDSRGLLLDHQGRAIQLGYRDKQPILTTKKVFGANAAAALFSRAYLDAQPFGNDYFDSDMWMYLEDVDIAARAVITGWENWFVNESRAYHMGSASSSKNPGFSIFMSYRNNAFLIVKNFPVSMIIRILPGLIATDMQSIYRHIRGHNRIAIKAMIRARLYSLLHLSTFIRKRSVLKKQWAVSRQEVWQLMADKDS